MEHHPDFVPGNYPNLTQVPLLFNQSGAMLKPASIDVNQVSHEQELQQIVASLSSVYRRKPTENKSDKSASIEVSEQQAVDLAVDPLQEQVDAYFCAVIDSGQAVSALEYFSEKQLSFDPEVWLYQVIGGYQALDDDDKHFFAIDPIGHADEYYTGNFIIHDVTLGLR